MYNHLNIRLLNVSLWTAFSMQERIFGRFHQFIKPHEYLRTADICWIPSFKHNRGETTPSIWVHFLYEVITKRIPSLNDLRKGLASVKVSQTTLLDLLERLPDVQKLVFPPHTGKIGVMMLKLHLEWRETANPINQTTEQFFNT